MQQNVKQVFYFHAGATALGGYLDDPFRYVTTPASVALPATGGHVIHETKDFRFDDSVKAGRTYTYAAGKPAQQNGPWTQRVVSIVEGFDLLGRITADLLVAQMFIEQPAAGGGPRKISFAGSEFKNLKVDGKPIKPVIDTTLLPDHHRGVDAYNRDATFNPELEWPALTAFAVAQGKQRIKREASPTWLVERLGWIADVTRDGNPSFGGYTLCSLVDQIDDVIVGQAYSHVLEVPDLGRIFLGEVTVLPYSAHLTMVRAELGCKVSGQVSAGTVVSNGTTMPPN